MYKYETSINGTYKMKLSLTDQALLKTQAFIDGRWVSAAGGETYKVTNPVDESVVADVTQTRCE